MQENQLKEIYVEELKDLYSAENQLVKALPKMAKAATSDELRAGFEEHLEQTKGHVQRLEDIFKTLGESPKGKTCKGMQGLITEGSEMIEEEDPGEGLDVGLISAAQRVEHYEIAGYGSVAAYADLLGEEEAASLLRTTLQEEKETDQKLTELAREVNVEAAGATSSDKEDETDTKSKKQASKSRTARA
jgi:ferritin-like metal-binding protein YciE